MTATTMTIAYMAKRNITSEDLAAAKRLEELWLSLKESSAKKNEPISEAAFAEKLGMSQSMFSQLKSGKTTWSTDHVLQMAHVFKVPPNSFKKIPYLDFVPNPQKERQELKLSGDNFWATITWCYPGLSDGHKDALSMMANKLYVIDHPEDRVAGPFNEKKEKVKR
jgi:transcriptional regulator with XRE-family HTH domain